MWKENSFDLKIRSLTSRDENENSISQCKKPFAHYRYAFLRYFFMLTSQKALTFQRDICFQKLAGCRHTATNETLSSFDNNKRNMLLNHNKLKTCPHFDSRVTFFNLYCKSLNT